VILLTLFKQENSILLVRVVMMNGESFDDGVLIQPENILLEKSCLTCDECGMFLNNEKRCLWSVLGMAYSVV